jgi:DNA primase
MPGATGDPGTEPGLTEEDRLWEKWKPSLFEGSRTSDNAAALAARVWPDQEFIASVRRHAESAAAKLAPPAGPVLDAELVRVHAATGRFFQACLRGSWVPEYLGDRGLAAALLPNSPWKIGYAPATWTALTDHLRGQGYADATLLRSGLVAKGRGGRLYDRFRDRLMIPLRNENGIAIAFIGRRHPDATGDANPKYLNSPDTALFTKGNVLAGLAEGRRFLARGAEPVLVEGPMDALAVAIAAPGKLTGITLCGTSLTSHQVGFLSRAIDLPARGIRVALDADAAGRKAAIGAYSLLQPATADITAVILPDGRDPADILCADGRDTLTTSICPLADLVVDARIEDCFRGRDDLDIEGQVRAVRGAAKIIATMPPSEAASQAVRLSAIFGSLYDWRPEELNRELVTAVENRYEQGNPVGLPPAYLNLVASATAPASAVPASRRSRIDERSRRSQPPLHNDRERS